MMTEFWILLGTAATLGFVHTVLGPDHYVPFIAIAKARNWSNRRALGITLVCGIGHVLSSALIGAVGLLIGTQVLKLEALESLRGSIAGWLLFGFGLAYMIWGIRRAIKKVAPSPVEIDKDNSKTSITPWVLFIIFVFGPCEPLIPILMYPAVTASVTGLIAVTVTFCLFTVGTMLVLVYAAVKGLSLVPRFHLVRYAHALAGFVILTCGAGMSFLGL